MHQTLPCFYLTYGSTLCLILMPNVISMQLFCYGFWLHLIVPQGHSAHEDQVVLCDPK